MSLKSMIHRYRLLTAYASAYVLQDSTAPMFCNGRGTIQRRQVTVRTFPGWNLPGRLTKLALRFACGNLGSECSASLRAAPRRNSLSYQRIISPRFLRILIGPARQPCLKFSLPLTTRCLRARTCVRVKQYWCTRLARESVQRQFNSPALPAPKPLEHLAQPTNLIGRNSTDWSLR